MIDIKTGVTILVILVIGVYLGNMWSHKMIVQQEERAEALRIQAETAAAAAAV